MEKIFAQFNIDAMVFGAIAASIILAFILVVVIFSVRYKSQYEKIADLRERLKEKEEKIALLEESMKEVQILNATQLQEIQQYQDLEERYKAEKAKVEEQLALAKERIEAQREKIADLEAKRAELEANLNNTRENLAKANEEIENVRKRNEFWVEQLSELRTKHEAVKSKLRRHEG
jgi:chromosome segregation ATPase